MKTETKYFLGAFLLTSIVLTTIFFIATAINGFSETKTELEPTPVTYSPKSKDSLTLLTAITDEEKNSLVFPLVRYDSLTGTFNILSFPAETKVFLDGEGWTITNVYSQLGISGVKNALSQTFLINVDRTAETNIENFCTAFGKLGIVEYRLPHDVSFEDGGVSINISKGMQPLDSNMLKYILQHSLDTNTLDGANILTNIYSETIKQKINMFIGSKGEKLFSTLVNFVNTDFSAYDFSTRQSSLQYTTEYSDNLTKPLEVSGTMVEDSLFISKETLDKIKSAFIL